MNRRGTREQNTASMQPADVAIAVLLALTGVALLAFVTRTGLALRPNSESYLGGAHSLAHGHGYTDLAPDGSRHAIVDFPPLTSFVLVPFDWLGVRLIDAFRWLNLLVFGASAAVLYTVLLRNSSSSRTVAFLGTGAFVLAPTVIGRFAFALSEPLFLFLLVVSIDLLDRYLRRPRLELLAAASIAAGLAGITRNVGVAVAGSGIIALAALGTATRPTRRRAVAVFAACSLFPFALWTLWSAFQPPATNRELGLHFTLQRAQNAYGVVARWIIPEPVPGPVRAVAFALLLVTGLFALVWASFTHREQGGAAGLVRKAVTAIRDLPYAPTIALLFSVTFSVVLAATMLFLDPLVRSDQRILSPLLVALIVVAGGTLHARDLGSSVDRSPSSRE